MPPLPPTIHLDILVHRNTVAAVASSVPAANATSDALQVVCAWPVSGQYGPGSRVLYYVLIAACIFARKADWLRQVCLAAALLFPAVAAIHAIVLAAAHVDDAIDMDVYGALQLCSIGILAAQVTVRNSRTYFNAPGRNTIFLWTGLILAGLLSLTVEFNRIKTFDCRRDGPGNPISSHAAEFPYSDNPTCGLTCSVEQGPYSPLRGGSANNIYVIPAPGVVTFGSAMLLAAACCVPAILSLAWMWNKIRKINWNTRFGNGDDNEQIEGTNGATIGKMKVVNEMIRVVLGGVENVVFGGIVLAIIIVGERNFFSSQVRYQTEPMANIGQWAPIVGTGLAAIGSLYLVLAKDVEEGANPKASMYHCNDRSEDGVNLALASSNSITTPGAFDISGGGHRYRVTRALTKFGNYFSAVDYDRFDDSEFRRGHALDYPQVPAEIYRNDALPRIRVQYNQSREVDESVTPTQRSRAASVARSPSPSLGVDGGSTGPRAASFQASSIPSTTPRRPDPQSDASSSRIGSTGDVPQMRRATLEVPPQVHHSPTRNN